MTASSSRKHYAEALSRRVSRAASNIPEGLYLLAILRSKPCIDAMKLAIAHFNTPPVSVLAPFLESLKTKVNFEDVKIRQFIGSAVRMILLEEGYDVHATGVRITNNLFSSGSTYYLIEPETEEKSLIERFIRSLNNDELLTAKSLIERLLKEKRGD